MAICMWLHVYGLDALSTYFLRHYNRSALLCGRHGNRVVIGRQGHLFTCTPSLLPLSPTGVSEIEM